MSRFQVEAVDSELPPATALSDKKWGDWSYLVMFLASNWHESANSSANQPTQIKLHYIYYMQRFKHLKSAWLWNWNPPLTELHPVLHCNVTHQDAKLSPDGFGRRKGCATRSRGYLWARGFSIPWAWKRGQMQQRNIWNVSSMIQIQVWFFFTMPVQTELQLFKVVCLMLSLQKLATPIGLFLQSLMLIKREQYRYEPWLAAKESPAEI